VPNRLAGESSPYLRQHADNPVEWWPWGSEAFAEARRRDVPVLLSVGYSACHWCHVMAHESFEDEPTAAVMNERFVNVKVDREQRPDVDAVYMEATQAMTGHGGWPMTVFLTPDGDPFHCGTYFPKVRRGGMPSFVEVLDAVTTAWTTQREDLVAHAGTVTESLRRSGAVGAGERPLPPDGTVDRAVDVLLSQVDRRWGGFGTAPKFPHAMSVDLLLRSGRDDAREAAVLTLDAMASGGIWDHLGGGFARYSTDERWLVPHFEKMLYDSALLLPVYAHAGMADVAAGIVEYLARDLRLAGGGFASAEDADSEGEEGRFYVWSPADMSQEAAAFWGVTEGGNFEGRSILNRLHARGARRGSPAIEAERERLLEVRSQRVRPGLDDKVLTEWNALAISGLCEAGIALDRSEWISLAVDCAGFLLDHLRGPGRRWLRSWQADAGASVLAFAADHAALVDAFTRLYEATGTARWIAAAVETADALLDLFLDEADGGFFTTGRDGEALVARQKDLLDNATPAANSSAAVALLRLSALTGVDRYRTAAEDVVRMLGRAAGEHPTAFAHLLVAVDLLEHGIDEIVVTGSRPDLLAVVRSAWRPRAVLAWGERFDSPLWEGRPDDGKAYVCRGYVCEAPVSSPDDLAAMLAVNRTAT
jgi:uncharacterized protein YyaL (SSP411 family)